MGIYKVNMAISILFSFLYILIGTLEQLRENCAVPILLFQQKKLWNRRKTGTFQNWEQSTGTCIWNVNPLRSVEWNPHLLLPCPAQFGKDRVDLIAFSLAQPITPSILKQSILHIAAREITVECISWSHSFLD